MNGDYLTGRPVRQRRRHVACLPPCPSSLLNGKADLSGEMALRIEKAFGVRMDTLMRMQSNYDITKTRSREKEIKGIRRFNRNDIHPH